MNGLINILIYSLINGASYAMVALGYSLIYSVLGFINFAHGDLLTIGVYACWFFGVGDFGFPLPVSIAFAVGITCLVSFILGKLLLIPVTRRSGIAALLVSIGISIIIQNAIQMIFTPDAISFYPSVPNQSFALLPFKRLHILMFFFSVTALCITWFFFLKKTKLGLEIRACASNPAAAYIFGLRSETVFSIVFLLSGFFAAIAGIFKGFDDQIITPVMGFSLGLRAFIASVIGGITNYRGAVAGAFILGLMENISLYSVISVSFLTPLATFISKDVIALILLIIILLWKPKGLFSVRYESRP